MRHACVKSSHELYGMHVIFARERYRRPFRPVRTCTVGTHHAPGRSTMCQSTLFERIQLAQLLGRRCGHAYGRRPDDTPGRAAGSRKLYEKCGPMSSWSSPRLRRYETEYRRAWTTSVRGRVSICMLTYGFTDPTKTTARWLPRACLVSVAARDVRMSIIGELRSAKNKDGRPLVAKTHRKCEALIGHVRKTL